METKDERTIFATGIVQRKSTSELIDAIKSLEILLEEDFRNVIMLLTLYYDVAKRIDLDPDLLFMQISEEVGPEFRTCLVNFGGRSEEDKRLASALYRWKDDPENCYVGYSDRS